MDTYITLTSVDGSRFVVRTDQLVGQLRPQLTSLLGFNLDCIAEMRQQYLDRGGPEVATAETIRETFAPKSTTGPAPKHCAGAGHPKPHMSCAMLAADGTCKMGALCEHQVSHVTTFCLDDVVELLSLDGKLLPTGLFGRITSFGSSKHSARIELETHGSVPTLTWRPLWSLRHTD